MFHARVKYTAGGAGTQWESHGKNNLPWPVRLHSILDGLKSIRYHWDVKTICLTTVLAAVLTGWAAAGDQTIDINRYSFGAIAYSPTTGKFGYSYNYRNRATAEKVALQNCHAVDARVVGWVNAGFLAL